MVLVVVILANLVYALPYSKLKPEDVVDPEYRAPDIELWYSWFGPATGMDLPTFGGLIRRFLFAYYDTVGMLRSPFKPAFDFTHTNQQWGLFAVVTENPDTLLIEVRRNGEWELLYRRLDGEHDWHDAQLKFRRIRGVWDGVKAEPKGTYKRMTVWIARTIFEEQPRVDRVRVVLERSHIALPWEPLDPETTRRAERYHKRENHTDPPERDPDPVPEGGG